MKDYSSITKSIKKNKSLLAIGICYISLWIGMGLLSSNKDYDIVSLICATVIISVFIKIMVDAIKIKRNGKDKI
jgi:quinol-cytochrome oxidoreductase complex cytochrome b subunit